jgi:hypothetical protein
MVFGKYSLYVVIILTAGSRHTSIVVYGKEVFYGNRVGVFTRCLKSSAEDESGNRDDFTWRNSCASTHRALDESCYWANSMVNHFL